MREKSGEVLGEGVMAEMPLDKGKVFSLFKALPELEKVLNLSTAEAVHGAFNSVI